MKCSRYQLEFDSWTPSRASAPSLSAANRAAWSWDDTASFTCPTAALTADRKRQNRAMNERMNEFSLQSHEPGKPWQWWWRVLLFSSCLLADHKAFKTCNWNEEIFCLISHWQPLIFFFHDSEFLVLMYGFFFYDVMYSAFDVQCSIPHMGKKIEVICEAANPYCWQGQDSPGSPAESAALHKRLVLQKQLRSANWGRQRLFTCTDLHVFSFDISAIMSPVCTVFVNETMTPNSVEGLCLVKYSWRCNRWNVLATKVE